MMEQCDRTACAVHDSVKEKYLSRCNRDFVNQHANPSVFLTGGESSFGDLYIEGHRVGSASILDDELVLPVLIRRDLNRTLRSGRVIPSDFCAGGVVDEKEEA